ncbi:MAG TPA: hypothetical protein VF815_00570 [Myxococcaceae bacterium]
MRIEADDPVASGEARIVRNVVAGVEAHSEAAGLASMVALGTLTDGLDPLEINIGEGLVAGDEQGRAEQRPHAQIGQPLAWMDTEVQREPDPTRACVIRVLEELLRDSHAACVVVKNALEQGDQRGALTCLALGK